jgi:hypothetical protein
MPTDSTLLQILQKLEQIESEITKINHNDFGGWLDIKKAVKYSGLSQSTLMRAYRKGKLKLSKRAGKTLTKRHWIDRFLEGR